MTEKILLPCPHCGKEAKIVVSGINEKYFKVECARQCTSLFDFRYQAVKQWNTRK